MKDMCQECLECDRVAKNWEEVEKDNSLYQVRQERESAEGLVPSSESHYITLSVQLLKTSRIDLRDERDSAS